MKTKIIKGKYNTIETVEPSNCYFIAHYKDGTVKGNNLIDTGWQTLRDGIVQLEYKLSTGKVIRIPKFEAYLHLVEVSQSLDTGNKVFHNVHIKGQTNDGEVINYAIILKQTSDSEHKIGDVMMSKDTKCMASPHWKKAAKGDTTNGS